MPIGFYFIFLVYRENTYTSATIEVAANQKVIESGPYAVVRPPNVRERVAVSAGHASRARLLLGTAAACSFTNLAAHWIVDEEKMLTRELEGYAQYRQRVRYRL